MKSTRILLFAAAAILAAGCSKNEPGDGADGVGTLSIRSTADREVETRAAATPSGADFSLHITGNEFDQTWKTLTAFEASNTDFKKGDYTASIAYGDPKGEGVDKPYFTGEKAFTIVPRRLNTVEITAKLANSQAFVGATEQFLKYFHDAQFTLTSASGKTYDFKPGTDAPGEVIYLPAATSLKVTGSARRQSATGTDEGPEVTFPAQELKATKPRTRHTFTFDAKDSGSATLTITLGEEFVETREIPIELNDDAVYE